MARAILLAAIVLLLAAPTAQAGRIEDQQANAAVAICKVFGKTYCAEALRVAWCESKHYPWARNGQYRGIFQMGDWERRTFGHGSGSWAQARAAWKYFVVSGKDWSPWACRWAAGR